MIETRFVDHFSPKTLDEMSRRSRQLSTLVRRFVKPMKEDQAEHADKEEGEDGSKWPALAAATSKHARYLTKSKRQKGQRIVEVTKVEGMLGVLPEVTVVQARGFSLFARPPSRLAHIAKAQHFGGAVGRGSVLPARSYIYVSEKLARDWVDAVGRFVIHEDGKGPLGRDSKGRFTR